jgi:hypothetical protein
MGAVVAMPPYPGLHFVVLELCLEGGILVQASSFFRQPYT